MTFKLNRRAFVAAASAAASSLALVKPALAGGHTVHEVQMLNKHPEDPKLRQVFFPRIIVVKPGDAVSFVGVDKGHNSASAKDMIPEGAEAWNGRVNDDIEVTFDTPGFYGYQCTPHATAGMVGLVIVEGEGMMDNLEDAQGVRQRGKAKATWEDIWAEVEGMEFEMTS
ncbi:MAG: pseudoazurin [Pseudomonadota bacterium]